MLNIPSLGLIIYIFHELETCESFRTNTVYTIRITIANASNISLERDHMSLWS